MVIAAPASAGQRWCVSGPSASTGSPSAATSGHTDPPGTWTGAGGTGGGSCIGAWCSVFQRGRRLSTFGITEKLYAGGGDGTAHSRVAPPHGSFGAGVPLVRGRQRVKTNTSGATPSGEAPIVEAKVRPQAPRSGE